MIGETIANQDFEVACLSHGKPIIGGAAKIFRKKWGRET